MNYNSNNFVNIFSFQEADDVFEIASDFVKKSLAAEGSQSSAGETPTDAQS